MRCIISPLEVVCRENYDNDAYLKEIYARLRGSVVTPTVKKMPFEMRNGLIWFKSHGALRLCVPRVKSITNRILYELHDTQVAGHPGLW